MTPGIFSAKLIKRRESHGPQPQRGPLPPVQVPDPREELLKASLGPNDWYRANGAVEIPAHKVQFLGS